MDKARFLGELGQQLVDEIEENIDALQRDADEDIAAALLRCKSKFVEQLGRECMLLRRAA